MSMMCFFGAASDSPRARQIGDEVKTRSVEHWCEEHQWPPNLFVPEERGCPTLIQNPSRHAEIIQKDSSGTRRAVEPMPWQAISQLAVLDDDVAGSQLTQEYQKLLLTSLKKDQGSQSSISDYGSSSERGNFDLQAVLTVISSQMKKLVSEFEALQAQYGSSAVVMAEWQVGEGNVLGRLLRLEKEISTFTHLSHVHAIVEER